jgi:hypothetical protein
LPRGGAHDAVGFLWVEHLQGVLEQDVVILEIVKDEQCSRPDHPMTSLAGPTRLCGDSAGTIVFYSTSTRGRVAVDKGILRVVSKRLSEQWNSVPVAAPILCKSPIRQEEITNATP